MSVQATARQRRQTPTTLRGEVRATGSLAFPLAITNLAQMALGATDVIMVGWLGPEKLAAAALAANLFFPLYQFGLGVASATAPIISQALGGRRFRHVRRTVRQGLWVCVLLAVPMSVLLYNGEAVILLLGQTSMSAELGGEYLRVLLWGLLPALWFVVLRSFLVSHQRPRAATVITIIAVALNVLANYGLMFGNFGLPRLELVGAAIATVIVDVFMFAALLGFVIYDRRLRRYHVLVRIWRSDWPLFREILRIGVPIGLTILAEMGLFAVSVFLMGLIGTTEVAAHAIATTCAGITFMIPLAIGHAAIVRVGWAVGAGNYDAARVCGQAAFGLGMVCAVVSALTLWLADELIISAFLRDAAGATATAAAAIVFLHFAALFQLFDATQAVMAGALRGLKDTTVPMLIANAGYWGVGLGSAVLLGFGVGLAGPGIWIGLALGLGTVGLLLTVRFWRLLRRAGIGTVAAT